MRRPANLEATSQLALGARGHLHGEPFTLASRRCIQGSRGQIWNEWSLRFETLVTGRPPVFLAESWGSFALFREGELLPALDRLTVGAPIELPWTVIERGVATRLAAWGDAPDAAESYDYADLSHHLEGRSASVAEGQTFLGEATDPEALGLARRAAPPVLVPAPNVSMPSGVEPWLDVGDVGSLEGVPYRVLGVVARRVVDDPTRWQDYLLHNANVGLRWLSVAEGHWTYAVPVEVGPTRFQVQESAAALAVTLEWAAGELPWSAEIGERALLSERADLVFEYTSTDVSASRIYELTPDVIARAFGKRNLPRPR